MRSTFEKSIRLLVIVIAFIISLYGALTKQYILFILSPIIFGSILVLMDRYKKTIKHVRNDFKILGYETISERNLKLKEIKVEFDVKPTILTSGSTSIKNYKSKFKRIYLASDKDGELLELNSIITENKNGIIKIIIIEKNYCQ